MALMSLSDLRKVMARILGYMLVRVIRLPFQSPKPLKLWLGPCIYSDY